MISLLALCAIGFQEPSCNVVALPFETEAGSGKPIEIGIRFEIEPGWHIYWLNPGDSGEATTVQWTLPEGWQAVDLRFPTPHAINAGGLLNYGYENETTLVARIRPPATYRGEAVTLQGEASYLICKEACIPGSRKFSISLPGKAMDPGERLAAVRGLPTPYQRGATAEYVGNALSISIPEKQVSKARFFPHEVNVLDHSAVQRLDKTAEGYSIVVPLSEFATSRPAKVTGVLVLTTQAGSRGYTVTLTPKVSNPQER